MEKKVLGIIIVIAVIVVLVAFRSEITGKLGYISQGVFVCEDSDNSKVEDGKLTDFSHIVKGTVTTSKSSGKRSASVEDSCVGTGKNKVSEYYCTDSNEAGLIREIDCETGVCDDGACVGCYDSDGGKNIDNRGISYFSDGTESETGEDECVLGFEGMVKEYFCEGGKLVSEEIQCEPQEICKEGFCRRK